MSLPLIPARTSYLSLDLAPLTVQLLFTTLAPSMMKSYPIPTSSTIRNKWPSPPPLPQVGPQRSPYIRRRHNLHSYASLVFTNRSYDVRRVGAPPHDTCKFYRSVLEVTELDRSSHFKPFWLITLCTAQKGYHSLCAWVLCKQKKWDRGRWVGSPSGWYAHGGCCGRF